MREKSPGREEGINAQTKDWFPVSDIEKVESEELKGTKETKNNNNSVVSKKGLLGSLNMAVMEED